MSNIRNTPAGLLRATALFPVPGRGQIPLHNDNSYHYSDKHPGEYPFPVLLSLHSPFQKTSLHQGHIRKEEPPYTQPAPKDLQWLPPHPDLHIPQEAVL